MSLLADTFVCVVLCRLIFIHVFVFFFSCLECTAVKTGQTVRVKAPWITTFRVLLDGSVPLAASHNPTL